MGSKHGPNRLDNYQLVHETRMQHLIASGFVLVDTTEFLPNRGAILLVGAIGCLGEIHVEVIKTLAILDGDGPDATVQTESYSYNVALRGVGNIFRYDSPHAMPGERDPVQHHNYHHKHVYDVLSGDKHGHVVLIEREDDIPTLGEVIEEAAEWYYNHLETLSKFSPPA